ncbi:hypothetical protein COF68_06250 [Bacillus toyonensis]|uniref:hypothetical protein n=1 Tax=Bacillus toyonensis TaxID=155322 RepID=UPI000BFE04B3|nr:hypothetical protein [Bacillus toyonensis]PHE64435.1 hypothetical protein COF68_06250 [Bacillus toyonensis]
MKVVCVNCEKETFKSSINKTCIHCHMDYDVEYTGSKRILEDEPLYNADENCEHDIQPANGGGVKCTKCSGWFCY